MAEPASQTHCPDCGAPVKSGEKQCWMCFRPRSSDGGIASLPGKQPRVYYRKNFWAIGGIVLAGFAMIPAIQIAAESTCYVAIVVGAPTITGKKNSGDFWASELARSILANFAGAFIVLIALGVIIAILTTRVTRKIEK